MSFIGRFLMNFLVYGVFAALITAFVVFLADILLEPDRELFKTEAAWFGIGLVALVGGFVIGLARTLGWDGKS